MSIRQGHNSIRKIVPFIVQASKFYLVYTGHFNFGVSNLQPFLNNLFFISLYVRLFKSLYSFSITFEIYSLSVSSHTLMFFVEGYIFKFFKILFRINHNRTNACVTNIFYFVSPFFFFFSSRFHHAFPIETRMGQKHLIFLQFSIVLDSEKLNFSTRSL